MGKEAAFFRFLSAEYVNRRLKKTRLLLGALANFSTRSAEVLAIAKGAEKDIERTGVGQAAQRGEEMPSLQFVQAPRLTAF